MAKRSRMARSRFGIDTGPAPDSAWRRDLLAASGLAGLHRLRERCRQITDPYELAGYALNGLRVSLRAQAPGGVSLGQAFPATGAGRCRKDGRRR